MSDKDKPKDRRDEAKHPPKNGEERPEETTIVVEKKLLSELPELQEDLGAFIKGYIDLQDLLDLCEIIENHLVDGIGDRGAMDYKVFWDGIYKRLEEAKNKYQGLKTLIDRYIDPEIKASYERNQQELRNAIFIPLQNPRGSAKEDIASTGLNTIREMKTEVQLIIVQIKDEVTFKLDRIKKVINSIEDRINFPQKKFVGYESKEKIPMAGSTDTLDKVKTWAGRRLIVLPRRPTTPSKKVEPDHKDAPKSP